MVGLFVACSAKALCPFSDNVFSSLKEESQIAFYKSCAEGMNDDESQVKLAELYLNGTTGIPRDIKKALFYYQLSADNGNAESQARLAQLYMELDKNPDGRRELYAYKASIMPSMGRMFSKNADNDFKGEFLHPYVLLVLSTEKASNKWYYPTTVVQAPEYAAKLLQSYKLEEAKKKELLRQATAWKKRKLLEIAQQILPQNEYDNFVNTLYPTKGQPDNFKRSQALRSFQEKVQEYKKQDEESAKAFY